ncbi:hypothetical protein BV898_14978 [Hypsibius exemplaris]|uniref:Uncharacterized protein n=1 Tax=Hypsibius exemplaris TaxID=2072580 RepID=A0A9X6RJZ6_HYPEX|nr:hypothetical protein BV898_14978 [Hypsibius exemplaris]
MGWANGWYRILFQLSSDHLTITAWIYSTSVVCILGASLNHFVLIVLLRFPVLRKGVGHLIAHLLLCQFLMCAAPVPVFVARVASLHEDPGSMDCWQCKAQHVFHVILSAILNWNEALSKSKKPETFGTLKSLGTMTGLCK